MRNTIARRGFASLILLALSGALWAEVPDVKQQNGIDYLTGGVGLEESTAIKEEAKRWPLKVMMSELSEGKAVWIADAELRIKNQNNRLLLDIKCDGPFALIRLDPGKYTIEATFNGMAQKRQVLVVSGSPQQISITWKANLR